MTQYYCQHGIYGFAFNATPTFGTAQEGDGAAIGAATVAQGSLLINAVATAGNTVTIMGVTLTAVASGATAAQFNVGGTTSVQADNIAAAINLASATVISGVSPTTPQLRDLLYAIGPATGAAANTVQIQTRAGGTSMNFATNATVAITAASWSTAPTITNFVGGLSGAWGYFVNDQNYGTIWKSAKSIFTYGIGRNASGLGPLIGNIPTATDTVNIRAGSPTQSNTTITSSIGVTCAFQPPFSSYYLVDDSTIWTADASVTFSGASSTSINITGIASTAGLVAGQSVAATASNGVPLDTTIATVSTNSITLSRATTSTSASISITATPTFVVQNLNSIGYQFSIGAGPNAKVYIGARSANRFQMRVYHPSGGPSILLVPDGNGYPNSCIYENIVFMDSSFSGGSITTNVGNSGNNQDIIITGGSFTVTRNNFYSLAYVISSGYNYCTLTIDGTAFNWPSFNGTPTYICSLIGFNYSGIKVAIKNCTTTTSFSAPGLLCFGNPPGTIGPGCVAIAENNQGFSVNSSLGIVGINTQTTGTTDSTYILQQNVGATRQFRVENNSFSLDWAAGSGFPTLTATLPDLTLWSYRLFWAGPLLAGAARNWSGIEVIKLVKTVTLSSIQTVAVELYVPSALAPSGATPLTNYNVMIAVSYVAASDGKLYTEYSTPNFYNRLNATNIPASTATWAANSFGGYSPIKLGFTLSRAVQINTEVDVAVKLLTVAPSASQTIFIHPDVNLS